jgi:protein-S-isoprenylcysteine O-methyltransferase Ste14
MNQNKADLSSTSDHPNMVIKPLTLYLFSILAGILLQWLRPWPLPLGTAGIIAGLLLIVGGVVVAWRASREFDRQGTHVNPDFPATAVVTTGPFRYSRNPMYVALTVIQMGVGLALGSLWLLITLLPALIILHVGVITREEVYLETKFGQAYRAYKAAVRRWI